MLQACLASIVEKGGVVLKFAFVRQADRHPSGDVEATLVNSYTAREDGTLDCSGMEIMAGNNGCKFVRQRVVLLLKKENIPLNAVPLAELLRVLLTGGHKVSSLLHQLIWQLGGFLDQVFLDAASGAEFKFLSVTCEASRGSSAGATLGAMHWQATHDFCQAFVPTCVSGSFDKSRVNSFGCQNSAFAVPSGELWFGVPQDLAIWIP